MSSGPAWDTRTELRLLLVLMNAFICYTLTAPCRYLVTISTLERPLVTYWEINKNVESKANLSSWTFFPQIPRCTWSFRSKYTWTAEGGLETQSATAVNYCAKQINCQNIFCDLVTKYLLDFGINVCVQGLLTPAVVLVFRGVRLGVWTAPPGLGVLWAHWRPLLLAGWNSMKTHASPNAEHSQQTPSG